MFTETGDNRLSGSATESVSDRFDERVREIYQEFKGVVHKVVPRVWQLINSTREYQEIVVMRAIALAVHMQVTKTGEITESDEEPVSVSRHIRSKPSKPAEKGSMTIFMPAPNRPTSRVHPKGIWDTWSASDGRLWRNIEYTELVAMARDGREASAIMRFMPVVSNGGHMKVGDVMKPEELERAKAFADSQS
jgi:hypothetical protein